MLQQPRLKMMSANPETTNLLATKNVLVTLSQYSDIEPSRPEDRKALAKEILPFYPPRQRLAGDIHIIQGLVLSHDQLIDQKVFPFTRPSLSVVLLVNCRVVGRACK